MFYREFIEDKSKMAISGKGGLWPDLTQKSLRVLVVVCCQTRIQESSYKPGRDLVQFSLLYLEVKRQLLCVPAADKRLRHITLHIPEIQFRVRPRLQQQSPSLSCSLILILQSAVVKTEYNARPASFSQLICLHIHGIVRLDAEDVYKDGLLVTVKPHLVDFRRNNPFEILVFQMSK